MDTTMNFGSCTSQEEFIQLLETLCLTSGVSGFEDVELCSDDGKTVPSVADTIAELIKPYVDSAYFDNSGNIIAFKKGRKTPKKRILFAAHMDEVGFMVKHICADGTLLFDSIGVSASSQPCQKVFVGKKCVPGIIGSKPVHLLSAEDRKKGITEDALFIDVGARSREQAQEIVSTGDVVLYDSKIRHLSENRIKAKALDDRIGCAALCALVRRELEYDTFFAFTTGEELGTRGAFAVASAVKPEVAVVVESTTASDIPGCDGADAVCRLGEGVVLPFMDGGTAYDRELRKFALEVAGKNGIKTQTKSKIAGGTDARTIQRTAGGCRVIGVALACRYIHTAAGVGDTRDIAGVQKLIFALADKLGEFDVTDTI